MLLKKYKINECEEVLNHQSRTVVSDNFNDCIIQKNSYCTQLYINNNSHNKISFSIICNKISEIQNIQKRAVRKDAITLVDVTLDAPTTIIKMKKKKDFFNVSFFQYQNFLANQGLIIQQSHLTGFVHYDEDIPHIHFVFMPIVLDKNNNPSFNAKKLIDINFLNLMKSYLSRSLSESFGTSILIVNTDREVKRSFSSFGDNQYQKKQKEYDNLISKTKHIQEKLEEVKAELKRTQQALADEKITLQEMRAEEERTIKQLKKISERLLTLI